MPLKELITSSVKQFLDTQKNNANHATNGPILQLKPSPSQQTFGNILSLNHI
jgi:hypothetical protein